MKKIIGLFLIHILTIVVISAQETPLFQTSLYFWDAKGNTDTIVIGNDPNADWNAMDEKFGCVDISKEPFDSVFEVRVSPIGFYLQFGDYWEGTHPAGKKQIDRGHIKGDGLFILQLNVKYPPISIQWEAEKLLGNLPSNASGIYPHFFDDFAWDRKWWEFGSLQYFEEYVLCLDEESRGTVDLLPFKSYQSESSGVPYFYDIEEIEGRGRDTIHLLVVDLQNEAASFNYCGLQLASSDNKHLKSSDWFPNPTSGLVFNKKGESLIYKVQDINGKVILEGKGKEINFNSFDSGIYFIRYQDTGNLFYQKIVKF